MNWQHTWHNALESSWIIIKLVIPIYILADLLYYYNALSHIAFLIEPFTSLLDLPPETSLAIISGIFLNLYAAVAFAAPLDLSVHQWSILAVFLGVCHSLIVESVIMKKLGISHLYSYGLRFFGGLLIAYSVTLMPPEWFHSAVLDEAFEQPRYENLGDLLQNSFQNAILLTIKIVLLISLLIVVMDFIKNLRFIQRSAKNVSKPFSILVGIVLGITYGAGILMKEANHLSRHDLFFIGTFLMICHAIIEDTLLFAIFGADFTMVVIIRTVWAVVLAYLLTKLYKIRYDATNPSHHEAKGT